MAANNDNELKGSGLLNEKKSKRLEEVLSSYSPEKTRQAVGRLLEEYVDEGGKNYFGAGRRDTTLYFADDDYVTEMKKQNQNSQKNFKVATEPDVVETADKNKPEVEHTEVDLGDTTIYEPVSYENDEPVTEENEMKSKDYDDLMTQIDDEEEYIPRRRRTEPSKNKKSKKVVEPEEELEDDIDIDTDYDEDDYEDDYDEDDYDDYDEDDDYESAKKKKFFGFFRNKDDEYDDDDEYYDDDDEDDDYYYDDDDDYYERGSVPVKKIFSVIFVIILLCIIAVLAAMCMNYKSIYESANSQAKELEVEIESLRAAATETTTLEVVTIADADSEETTKSTTGTASMSPDEEEAISDGLSVGDTPEGKEYVVQSGDTGQKICIGVYGEYSQELWEKLKKANGKGDTDWIAGETVKVP